MNGEASGRTRKLCHCALSGRKLKSPEMAMLKFLWPNRNVLLKIIVITTTVFTTGSCVKHCSKSFMCITSFNAHQFLQGRYFYSHFTDADTEAQRAPEISGYLGSLTPELTLSTISVNHLLLWTIPLENKETSYSRDIDSGVINSKVLSIIQK